MPTAQEAARYALAEQAWGLLPAAIRARDEQAGGALRALVEVLAAEAAVVAEDLDALADDWFIETCEEWLVPYIAELVGVRGLYPLPGAGFSNRARVADTLRFRRRKGTAAMLEELARTTTGWTAAGRRVLRDARHDPAPEPRAAGAPATARSATANAMELVGTPFDTAHPHGGRPAARRSSGRLAQPAQHRALRLAGGVLPARPRDRRGGRRAAGRPLARRPARRRPPARRRHSRRRPTSTTAPTRRTCPDCCAGARCTTSSTRSARRRSIADAPALVPARRPGAGPSGSRRTPATSSPPCRSSLLHVCDLIDWALPDRLGGARRPGPRPDAVAVSAAGRSHRLAVSWSLAFGGSRRAPLRPGRATSAARRRCRAGRSASASPTRRRRRGGGARRSATPSTPGTRCRRRIPARVGRIVVMDSHRYAEPLRGPGADRGRPGRPAVPRRRPLAGAAGRAAHLAASWTRAASARARRRSGGRRPRAPASSAAVRRSTACCWRAGSPS